MDDDLLHFYEHNQLGVPVKCTLGRALLFSDLVLQKELQDSVPMVEKDVLLTGVTVAAKMRSGWKEFENFLIEEVLKFHLGNDSALGPEYTKSLTDPATRQQLWENPQPLEAVLKGTPLESSLTKILKKRKKRISVVALWNKSTTHNPELRNNLWCGVSHEAATDLYQVTQTVVDET